MKEMGADADQALFDHDPRCDLVMATVRGWKLPVELIRDWHWRCLGDGVSAMGAELWLANDNGGGLTRLSDSRENFVDRHDLRHDCGSPVLPVTSIEDTSDQSK